MTTSGNLIAGNYNKKELLDKTIPRLLKSTNFVPVYKYLNGIGIHSTKELQEKGYYENTKRVSIQQVTQQHKNNIKKILRRLKTKI